MMQGNRSAPVYLSLNTTETTLELVGGKGHALAKAAAAGLPVPPGFCLTTAVYRHFIATNDLQAQISHLLSQTQFDDPASLQKTSTAIQALFTAGTMPEESAAAICEAYGSLGDETTVAVRSSATAEDLPGLSFAGQQETYLNVRGEAALLTAVRHCWASLWTARAIGYRQQMAVDQQTIAMGVVVQTMVPAEVSGILFTANPATGERDKFVVNASFGLGEAIVSGEVTPDTYILDGATGAVQETTIGTKEKMILSAPDAQGTITQPIPPEQRDKAALSPSLLSELAHLGRQVCQTFGGTPQDMEWAMADGQCWLLQSRPITNLLPPPLTDVRWEPPDPNSPLIRRQVVENMPDPLSPLFDELYLQVGLEESINTLLTEFGWHIDLEEFVDVPFFLTVNGYAYSRASVKFRWRTFWSILRNYVRTVRKFFKNSVSYWREKALPEYLGIIDQWRQVDLKTAADAQLLQGIRALAIADAAYWFASAMVLGLAKITDDLLNRFLGRHGLTSGLFLRGFPSKTLEAQVDLEDIARRIRQFEALSELVTTTPANRLLTALARHPEGQPVLDDIHHYLEEYGHQIYTLDFVVPTQAEDPLPVLLSLKSLVQDPGQDIADRQAEIVQEREAQTEKLSRSLGFVQRRVFGKLLDWAQRFGPLREEALFYIGAGWPVLRQLALALGQRMVEAGLFQMAEDVFYLESEELKVVMAARAAGQSTQTYSQLAHERRELREARKRLHPPAAVPPDYRYKLGPFDMSGMETQKRNLDEGQVLNGFAVSPGRVTAAASVIRSPADFDKMEPGTILVCPTTTPAWTPLFAQARGLVTDIGGILAHGSIVAREYGIPAVMGTGNATQRILPGQQITVDGSAGTVTMSD